MLKSKVWVLRNKINLKNKRFDFARTKIQIHFEK